MSASSDGSKQSTSGWWRGDDRFDGSDDDAYVNDSRDSLDSREKWKNGDGRSLKFSATKPETERDSTEREREREDTQRETGPKERERTQTEAEVTDTQTVCLSVWVTAACLWVGGQVETDRIREGKTALFSVF